MPPAQVRHGIDIHPQPCSLTIVMLSCVSHEKAFSHTCCAVRQVEGDSVTSLGFPSTRGLSPSGSLSGAQLLLLLGKKSTASFKDNLGAILSFAPTQAGRKKNFTFSDSYLTV